MKHKPLNSECIRCIANGHLTNYPAYISEDLKIEYMQGVLKILSELKDDESGPVMVDYINKLKLSLFGKAEDYSKIKHYYNSLMLQKEEYVWRKIKESDDPLYTAIQFALMGNYIDFGANSEVDEKKLEDLLSDYGCNEIDEVEYSNLKSDLEKGKSLVYLTDNCGEIVMDKLLIKVIREMYPDLFITSIVRGREVLNDATDEDAKQVGLDTVVRVENNGSGIAGTFFRDISDNTKELLTNADVIISKGQGNYETLQGCSLNVYYLFLCKCDLFVKRFKKERFSGLMINENR